MTNQQRIISGLLDVVLDEIARHEERIEYLRQVKAKLERLIEEDNDD